MAKKVLCEGIEAELPPPPKVNLDDIEMAKLSVGEKKHDAILDITTPVSYENERVGYIRMGISLERIREKVNKRILNSSIIVVIFISIGLVICFFFSRSLSKPISQLLEGVKRIGQGDRSYHVKVQNKNEIGELAIAFNQMIESLKQGEDALKESEETHRGILESMLDIYYRTDLEGKLILMSPSGRYLLGYDSVEDVIGRNLINEFYYHPNEKEIFMRDLMEHGVVKNHEVALKRKDGTLVIGESNSHFVYDKTDKPIAIEGIIRDTTDRKMAEEEKKRLETQLQRALKMEAIGNLAGGVAHDLNNVLSGLISYPELLLIDMPEDNPYRKYILKIQKSGEKAAAIVQDLLTMARRGVSVDGVVNLNTIIREYLVTPEYEKLKSYHPEVKVETNFETGLLNIFGSPIHLSKTVMNLVSNAAEAMPDGGKILISTKNCYIDKPIKGYGTVKEGDYVVLEVQDNGTGIPSEDLDRIFEPFFTKKVMGRSGTGLGMAVVWGTVEDHKGYIDVQSAQGKGTAFTLYFPVTRKKLVMDKSPSPIQAYKGNGESILVVDDVEEQQEIASVMLKKLGYSVSCVSGGEEAIEYMKDNSADLLVLDMIMDPGIDGLETYKRILEVRPGQKAIIVSGFSETDQVKEAKSLGVGQYIKKPYILEKIGLAIKEELEKSKINGHFGSIKK
ncbi:hypothetical protein DSCO28_43360 [Desulfosarcina ovata subsp. sediminis]|uniref:histidine kinase n=1 Tax=Desulfosarcina ovata subsp. sediminis TaxID=885957 RepID=A0A5K7ZU91_9BACT|nr:ATP-binding protein [Desulfosarcina ovata]BBO83770.1 hypothetical protein DSCO28_43360 [Desulfosarcina ovata subsp. sediminis]